MDNLEQERPESPTELKKEKKNVLILTFLFTIIIIAVIGFGIFHFFFGEKTTADVDLPSKEEVMDAEKTSDIKIYNPTGAVPVTEIQHRINKIHEYWNDELGYGKWRNYSFSANEEGLKDTEKEIRTEILPFVSGPLKEDIETAADEVGKGVKNQDIDALKMSHRIFHDLDITLNGYQSATTYWEVTETWKWLQATAK